MSWDAAAAIGELVGAAGVIASLLYLATQVRHSTRASKAAAGERAVQHFREFLAPIYADRHLLDVFGRAFADPETYSGPDRDQALHLMFQAMKASESIYYHYANGMLDPGTWKGWSTLLGHYFNTPGFRAYWAMRRDVFSPAFQDWAESLSTHTEGRAIGSFELPLPPGTA